jgi:prophage antirepressor-like protein
MSKVQSEKDLFFLDAFNQLLKYNKQKIIIIFDTDGNIWFALRDIFNMLGYNNINNAINTIKISDNNWIPYKKIKVSI